MTKANEPISMQYRDHNPGQWFLLQWQGDLYLDYRYSYSGIIDDSAFMKLSDEECREYEARGRAYLSELAETAHNNGPYRKESPYYARDLYRTPDFKELRAAVNAAIADHTWAAEQRRKDKD